MAYRLFWILFLKFKSALQRKKMVWLWTFLWREAGRGYFCLFNAVWLFPRHWFYARLISKLNFLCKCPMVISVCPKQLQRQVNNLLLLLFKAPPGIQLAQGPRSTGSRHRLSSSSCHMAEASRPLDKNSTVQYGGLLTVGLVGKQEVEYYKCHARNSLGET